MEQQDIIMLCQQNWAIRLGTNARNLAREFARHNRVLYVNMPLDINTLLTGFYRPEVRRRLWILLGLTNGLAQVEPNLWVYTPDCLAFSSNWLRSPRMFAVLNRLNAWLLARSIRPAARAVGFGAFYLLQDGLIFQGTELKRLLKPRKFIYYLRDYMVSMRYFQRHGPRVEAQLLQRADLVVANSPYLHDYARQQNPHSYDIGQGCVLTQYQAHAAYTEPADLTTVPGPRIGYTGFLTTARLDLNLLLILARERPDWHLVLVGPEDDDFARSPLHALPNVHFLGNKSPEQLSAYVRYFDVCINPQVINGMTVGNYPLKIDEYLAMGRPVVATHTRTMELFTDHVALAVTPVDWLAQLETALIRPDPARAARGMAFAHSHTWALSVGKLYAAERATDPVMVA